MRKPRVWESEGSVGPSGSGGVRGRSARLARCTPPYSHCLGAILWSDFFVAYGFPPGETFKDGGLH